MSLDKLHPQHLADLRSSGLSDVTIAIAGCYSVVTTESILGYENGPGLVFPYPGCGGYARVKVDQPDPEGTRYRSPKGSGNNHLYIPSLLAAGSDPPMLAIPDASDVVDVPVPCELVPSAGVLQGSAPLWITEGEKKDLKANQEGLSCIALSGVWNWRMKVVGEDGKEKSVVIPDLDLVRWKDRTVYLCFDNDAATNPDVLQAETMFAAELRRRGALVVVVRLPPGEAKGLDDFLMVHPVADLIALTREFNPTSYDRTTGQITSPSGAFNDWKEAMLQAAIREVHPDGADTKKVKRLSKITKAAMMEEFKDQNPQLVVEGEFAREIDAAWAALKRNNARDAGPFVFSYGNALVEIAGGRVIESSIGSLTDLLARVARWVKPTGKGEYKGVYPVDRIVKHMVRDTRAPMPPLRSLTPVPVFTRDGRLIQKPGYDADSGIYYAPGKFTIEPVPEHPVETDVARAKHLILDNLLEASTSPTRGAGLQR